MPRPSKKTVYLLYAHDSEKDANAAGSLSEFLTVGDPVSVLTPMAGSTAQDILEAVLKVDLVLPLISIDFLTSEHQMAVAKKSIEAGKLVRPILVRDCPWENDEALAKIKEEILPDEGSLIEQDARTIDRMLTKIAEEISFLLFGKRTKTKLLWKDYFLKIVLTICILLSVFSLLYVHDKFGFTLVFFLFLAVYLLIIMLPILHILKPTLLSTYLQRKK